MMSIPKENNLEETSKEYYLEYFVPCSMKISDCFVGKKQLPKALVVLDNCEAGFENNDWEGLQKL